MNIKQAISNTLLCSSVLLTPLAHSTAQSQQSIDNATQQALSHFDDNKFGMFIHWGLYSVPGGIYNGVPLRGISEWIQNTMDIPLPEYRQYADGMTLERYQPKQWAKLAKEAGMQYMVITAKHHDGFAMYDSKVSDYDMLNTPYGQDPMAPLAKAAKEQGIDFGFYYSQDQDWEDPNARGNTLDFDPKKAKPSIYLKNKALPQVHELANQYGELGFLWFDTPGSLSFDEASQLRSAVKQAQPSALINARIGHGLGDFAQTGDNAIPLQVWLDKGKWETPATINHSWGYHQLDNHWRQPKDLIAKLVDISSKGGNYLLNIGPKADGSIPEPSVKVLKEMGQWLAKNGDSIYGTRYCPFYFDQIQWRCTTKENKLYLHILDANADTITLEGLRSKVVAAKLLSNGSKVNFTQEKNLAVSLPKLANDYLPVVELELADNTVNIDKKYHHSVRPDVVNLFAMNARFRGQDLKYDWDSAMVSNFIDISKEKGFNPNKLTYRNELWWYPYGTLDGRYQVTVSYQCKGDDPGVLAIRTQATNTDDKITHRQSTSQAITCSGQPQQQKFAKTIEVHSETLQQLILGFDKFGSNTDSVKIHKVELTKL